MFLEVLDSFGLPAILVTIVFGWWINRKLKAIENIVYIKDIDDLKKDNKVIIEALEKEIEYLKNKVKSLPSKEEMENLRTAVSGVGQSFKENLDKDYNQEQKQWDNIHDIEKIIADLRVEIAAINRINRK